MATFAIIFSSIVATMTIIFIVACFLAVGPWDEKVGFVLLLIFGLCVLLVCAMCIALGISYKEVTSINQDISAVTARVSTTANIPEETPMMELVISEPEPEPEPTPEPSIEPEEPVLQILSADGFFYYSNYYKGNKLYSMPMTEEWQKIVYSYCQQYDLEYEIVMAISGVETSFDVHRGTVESKYNSATYFGLGMVNKYYYEKRTGTTLATERDGINALCDTLRRKLNEFDEDYIHALMAYNGGSAWARGKINQGIHTSSYVSKVLTIKEGLLKVKGETK